MCLLHSLRKEITHCWSPDLPGSLEAMITQVLSKGKHLLSSLCRAYTSLQRTRRQKYVSTWERNYDWAPACSLWVTGWILHARTIFTRTCADALKEREGSTEDTFDLGEIRNAGGTPFLETLLHWIKYASGGFMWYAQGLLLHFIFCATINYLVFEEVGVTSIQFMMFKSLFTQETLHYHGLLPGTCFSRFSLLEFLYCC